MDETKLQIGLRPGEKVEHVSSISPILFSFLIGAGVLVAIVVPILSAWLVGMLGLVMTNGFMAGVIGVGLLIGLAVVGYAFYFRAARQYVLTNERVIETKGWLSKRTVDAEFEEVTDIRIQQDPFERLVLKSGRVAVNTAGADATEIQFERIDQPYRITQKIRQLAEQRLEAIGRNRSDAPSLYLER